MRKVVSLIALVALLATAAVALAAQPSPSPVKVKTKLTATRGKGSKHKPVPVSVGYSLHASTANGSRPDAVKKLTQAWEGVRSYGKYFPKCSLSKIVAAQSDKVCPKGSLVASGRIFSLVGPPNDFAAPGAPCTRTARTYNAGQNKVIVIFVGPGSKCLGTPYTPPYTGKWTNKGGIHGGQTIVNIPPYFQTHPSGLLVSSTDLNVTFPKHVKRVHGKKVSYLMSVGCKGKRSARETYTRQPSGKTYKAKVTAGRC